MLLKKQHGNFSANIREKQIKLKILDSILPQHETGQVDENCG